MLTPSIESVMVWLLRMGLANSKPSDYPVLNRRTTSFSDIYGLERTRVSRTRKPQTVAILALPGVQLLDVSGPLDVFAEANVQVAAAAYQLRVIGSRAGPIRSSSGARLLPDAVIGERMTEKLDTVLVAGCAYDAAGS